MVRPKRSKSTLFYKILVVALIFFFFFAYKIYTYSDVLLSPDGDFNHTFGSLLFGFFVFGLIGALILVVVFFYFILHESEH